jgi:hypothetical protein
MQDRLRAASVAGLTLSLCACGLSVPQIPEVWDRGDPDATQHMEMQIKRAIFCELREAVTEARRRYQYQNYSAGKVVTRPSDQPVPDAWGAQVTLTFTVDEVSKVNPGVSLLSPLPPASAGQTFAFGLGGTASSQATRVDKFQTFYTIGQIANVFSKNNVCAVRPDGILGQPGSSSPFVTSDLGIRQWLPAATAVSGFLRSTRKAEDGEGAPLGSAGSFASDSISYDIKFVVTTDLNATPVWKLVRVTTSQSPAFFDTSRTRTHDLLITIGPGATEAVKGPKGKIVKRTVGPSQSAASSHLAQEIGNAVAAAIRPQ